MQFSRVLLKLFIRLSTLILSCSGLFSQASVGFVGRPVVLSIVPFPIKPTQAKASAWFCVKVESIKFAQFYLL